MLKTIQKDRGGLGPEIGGEEWKKKTEASNKKKVFSEYV